jgi:hypothetical protein
MFNFVDLAQEVFARYLADPSPWTEVRQRGAGPLNWGSTFLV